MGHARAWRRVVRCASGYVSGAGPNGIQSLPSRRHDTGSVMPATSKPLVFLIHGMGVFRGRVRGSTFHQGSRRCYQAVCVHCRTSGRRFDQGRHRSSAHYLRRAFYRSDDELGNACAQQLIDAATPAQKPQVQKSDRLAHNIGHPQKGSVRLDSPHGCLSVGDQPDAPQCDQE